ncbi:hypothetical protein AVEN_234880-1 [Araneus ventricosus]|uniref:Uncharacterized protein n=1 Tax=Araneus ventricosus TaxID=182803 RepID=A0A4Y2UZT2_ARAVE|nr:hypothetical protein AVEN_234880-1 [Araneus ventricosus]
MALQHNRSAIPINEAFSYSLASSLSDLAPCDFWLWGFIKDQVYREQPSTLSHLKDSIIRHVRGINEDLLCSAVEHTVLRMERVVENHGTHIELCRTFCRAAAPLIGDFLY